MGDWATLRFFKQVVKQPFWNKMQDLGYRIWSYLDFKAGVMHWATTIESKEHSPEELHTKIEDFIKEYYSDIFEGGLDKKIDKVKKELAAAEVTEDTDPEVLKERLAKQTELTDKI